ncbi:MAG: DUF5119 domain-containing protein [Alistipes sp.]
MKRRLYVLFALAAAMVGVSCEQKELLKRSDVEVDVEVRFDWSEAPDAAPKKMILYLFSETGGKPQRYTFNNAAGGRIAVPAGTYDALCVNGDTQGVLFRNETFAAYEAYTDNAKVVSGLNIDASMVPRAEGAERERMVMQTDKLWRGVSDDKFRVLLRQKDVPPLVLKMKPAYEVYNVTIRNVQNLDEAVAGNTKFGISVSGLAGSVALADGAFGTESVTIPSALTTDAANRTMTGKIVAFGDCTNASRQHFLMVYAILPDGQKYGFRHDVSAQIHNAANRRNVQIVIDGFDLPKPIGKDSGLVPNVVDWQIIDVPVTIK